MDVPVTGPRQAGPRDLFFFRNPEYWTIWPFLPVVRRRPGYDLECGVVYDFRTTPGPCGYGSTVFLSNLFTLPPTLEELLQLPREVFDTFDEMAAAGWVVD